MLDVLSRKLNCFTSLTASDSAAVDHLGRNHRIVPAGEVLVREGEHPKKVFLLLEGWAFRFKEMPDGRRQILAYLIPGDLCDIHIFILNRMDHGLTMVSKGVVAEIHPDDVLAIMTDRPMVARALWWATLVDEAILREWLVNQGRRNAYESLAHLFCEMWLRMNAVGLAELEKPFSLPLTQPQLGDTLGLTPVAVNRALQTLRTKGLISLSERKLTIHKPRELIEACGFEPNYLHLDARGAAPKATAI